MRATPTGRATCWYVYKPELPSAELYGIVWVWSTLLSLHQTAPAPASTWPPPPSS